MLKIKNVFLTIVLLSFGTIFCMENTDIPINIINQKKALNEEFNSKAKIAGLVSYIYYPTQKFGAASPGHAELEIEGQSWLLLRRNIKAGIKKSLDQMIYSSKFNESGLPFFRFIIYVTPEQLKKLREDIGKNYYSTCCYGALCELSKNSDLDVPFLFKLLPSVSSLYLYCAKSLGSKQIADIKFYGDKKTYKNNIKTMAPGIIHEYVMIGLLTSFAITIFIILNKTLQMGLNK